MNLQFLDIFIESRPSHELLCKNHSHFNGNGYFDNNYIQNLFLNGILTEGVTKMHHISPLMISSGCLKSEFCQIEHLQVYNCQQAHLASVWGEIQVYNVVILLGYTY